MESIKEIVDSIEIIDSLPKKFETLNFDQKLLYLKGANKWASFEFYSKLSNSLLELQKMDLEQAGLTNDDIHKYLSAGLEFPLPIESVLDFVFKANFFSYLAANQYFFNIMPSSDEEIEALYLDDNVHVWSEEKSSKEYESFIQLSLKADSVMFCNDTVLGELLSNDAYDGMEEFTESYDRLDIRPSKSVSVSRLFKLIEEIYMPRLFTHRFSTKEIELILMEGTVSGKQLTVQQKRDVEGCFHLVKKLIKLRVKKEDIVRDLFK